MEVLEIIQRALKVVTEVVKWGAGIQEKTRKELVEELRDICLNCEAAYDAVLKRLVPVKDAFSDKGRLAAELSKFAADTETRDKFKPEHLCGHVDHLLTRLGSNLDPLKYSIDVRRVDSLRRNLMLFGNFDSAIYQSYDELRSQLDKVAGQINDPAFDGDERARYAQHVIQEFDSDLRSALAAVREAKAQVVGII